MTIGPELDPLVLAGAKAKGKRPYFLSDADVERVLSITMAVAGEVAVLRARLDTIERLLERKGTLARKDIEAFAPSKAEAVERGRAMDEYVARILRIIQQDKEAMAAADQSAEEVAEELADG